MKFLLSLQLKLPLAQSNLHTTEILLGVALNPHPPNLLKNKVDPKCTIYMELSYKKQRKCNCTSYVSIVTLHYHEIKVRLKDRSERYSRR